MAGVALGMRVLTNVGSAPCERNITYRVFILIFTFFIYTSYHLSRKPISVVKNVLLSGGCNSTVANTSHLNASCGWPPFDNHNGDALLGNLDLAFLFSYAIGMFISGHVAERMDLRYYLTFGMVMSGVLTAMFGFGYFWGIHALWYYMLVQVFCGFMQATGWPSVVTVVANWFGKGKRGLIMGVWNSHTSVGNILGSVIAGVFVNSMWGWSFVVPGIIIFSMGLLVCILLVPRPEDVGCQPADQHSASNSVAVNSTGEADPLVQVTDDEEQPEVKVTQGHNRDEVTAISFIGALKIPGVVEFSLCLFCAKLVSYVFLFWLPTYIKHSTPYDPAKAADLSTVFDVGGIAGGILAGFVSDLNGSRASTCAVMLIAAAPMLFIYEKFGSMNLIVNIFMLLVCGALVNGPYALITTAVSADLGTHRSLHGNAKALSTVTAIIDGTGSVGAAIGPLLTGLISETNNGEGWANVFWMLIAADLLALVFLCRLIVKEVGSCCTCTQSSQSQL